MHRIANAFPALALPPSAHGKTEPLPLQMPDQPAVNCWQPQQTHPQRPDRRNLEKQISVCSSPNGRLQEDPYTSLLEPEVASDNLDVALPSSVPTPPNQPDVAVPSAVPTTSSTSNKQDVAVPYQPGVAMKHNTSSSSTQIVSEVLASMSEVFAERSEPAFMSEVLASAREMLKISRSTVAVDGDDAPMPVGATTAALPKAGNGAKRLRLMKRPAAASSITDC